MMKRTLRIPYTWLLFLLAGCLLPLQLLAQDFPLDPITGKIFYAEEVPVKDASKTELLERARAWLLTQKPAKAFRVNDAANGVIIKDCYSLFSVAAGSSRQTYQLWHTIKIEVEDDYFWYTLSGFQLQKMPPGKAGHTNRQPLESLVLPRSGTAKKQPAALNKNLQQKARESILALIEEMKTHMW